MTIQARDILLNSAHAIVRWSNTSCLLSCSLFYIIYGLFANKVGINLLWQLGPKIVGRTQKKEEHGREREVEDGRWRIKRGEMEKVPSLHWWHDTEFLTNVCMFDCEWHCRTMCTCMTLIVNLPPEQEGMDQFMREKKIIKWNNIIMLCHHRIYTDESLQHDDRSQRCTIKLCTCHCFPNTSCLLSFSLFYSIRLVL